MKKNPNKNESPKRHTRSAEQLAKDFATQGKVAGSRLNKGDEGKDAAASKDSGVRKNKRQSSARNDQSSARNDQSSAKNDQVRNISLLLHIITRCLYFLLLLFRRLRKMRRFPW